MAEGAHLKGPFANDGGADSAGGEHDGHGVGDQVQAPVQCSGDHAAAQKGKGYFLYSKVHAIHYVHM